MTTTAAGSIIYLEDVTVNYDGFKALSRLNFFMDRRELRVVIGPNGAGKTTLLDVVSGRVKPESGRVIFGRETDLLPLRENDIAQLGIGRKFQTPSVFVNLTVWDNVELSLRRASKGVFAALRRRDPEEERERIARTLDTVQLAAKADVLAGALAHGEKQWLEIGMVIAQDPELLLVDEPVAGMTDEETARTGQLLERSRPTDRCSSSSTTWSSSGISPARSRSSTRGRSSARARSSRSRAIRASSRSTSGGGARRPMLSIRVSTSPTASPGALGRRPRGRRGRARVLDGA